MPTRRKFRRNKRKSRRRTKRGGKLTDVEKNQLNKLLSTFSEPCPKKICPCPINKDDKEDPLCVEFRNYESPISGAIQWGNWLMGDSDKPDNFLKAQDEKGNMQKVTSYRWSFDKALDSEGCDYSPSRPRKELFLEADKKCCPYERTTNPGQYITDNPDERRCKGFLEDYTWRLKTKNTNDMKKAMNKFKEAKKKSKNKDINFPDINEKALEEHFENFLKVNDPDFNENDRQWFDKIKKIEKRFVELTDAEKKIEEWKETNWKKGEIKKIDEEESNDTVNQENWEGNKYFSRFSSNDVCGHERSKLRTVQGRGGVTEKQVDRAQKILDNCIEREEHSWIKTTSATDWQEKKKKYEKQKNDSKEKYNKLREATQEYKNFEAAKEKELKEHFKIINFFELIWKAQNYIDEIPPEKKQKRDDYRKAFLDLMTADELNIDGAKNKITELETFLKTNSTGGRKRKTRRKQRKSRKTKRGGKRRKSRRRKRRTRR